MYVVRHTFMAKNLMDARRKCKAREPDEIWISDEWKEGKNLHLAEAIGFHISDYDITEDED